MKRTPFGFEPARFAAACLLAGALLAPAAHADTPDEQYEQASGLYRAKLFSTAAQELKAFVDANPDHPQAKIAAYQWAAAIYRSDKGKNGVDYAAAAASYEWALQKYPTAPAPIVAAARYELGEAYYFLDKPEKVIAPLTEFLKSPGTTPEALSRAAWASYYIGKSYEDQNKPALAKAAFEKIRTTYPKSEPAPDALMEIGVINLDAGQAEAALEAFSAVSTQYATAPAASEAKVRSGMAYLALKNWTNARQSFNAALTDPKAAEWKLDSLRGLADADFGDKKWPAAATGYANLLKALPANDKRRSDAQLQLASSLFNAKDWPAAVTAYTPLTADTRPEYGAASLYYRGTAYSVQNKFTEAAADFQRFLELYPKHELAARAALRLGDAYAGAKDSAKAAQAYKLVLTNYPGTEAAKEAQGGLADLAGSSGAGEAVESALRALPAGAAGDARLRLAQNAFEAKQWTKAAQLAQTVYDGKPAAATGEKALYLIGSAKLNANDPAGAAAAFRNQLTAYPTGSLAGEAKLSLAWALEDAKQWPAAEAAARAAATSGPVAVKPRAQLTLAGILLKAGKFPDAVAAFGAVPTTDKDLASQAARGGAIAAEKAKSWKQAAASWGKFAALAPDDAAKANALLRQGQALREAKDAPGAQTAFAAVLAVEPKGASASSALYESAWLAQDNKQDALAVQRWTQLSTDFPDTAMGGEAAYQLGTTLYLQQKWTEAAAAFDRALQAKNRTDVPEDAGYWAGDAYRKAGNMAEAATRFATYVKAVEANPKASDQLKKYLPSARLGWGSTVTDPTAAAAIFLPAIAQSKGRVAPELSYRLGRALAESGKWNEALPHLLKVATDERAGEWQTPARWFAALALENTDKKGDALEMYRQVAAQPAGDWTEKAQAKVKELGG